jgi:ABC-type multidrug transport system ATPase subunit/CRP-like cAMP-binding protein/ABC-type multidrug transport system permease subunit
VTTRGTVSGELLGGLPLFCGCSPEQLRAIASSLERIELAAGDVIFREGDPGEEMYIVVSGQVRVVSDVQTEKVVFAHLGPGEFFGEMALVTGAARSAGVIATTDVQLWRLAKQQFDLVAKEHPEVTVEISRILGERVGRGNAQRFQNEAFTFLSLSPERREITIGRLPTNDLVLSDPQVSAIHARMRNMEGRWIIYDEDSATGTYVNRRRVRVAELADGDEILIGTNKVFLDGLSVKGFVGREGVRIDVLNLTKSLPDGRRILDEISVSIYPGEFVAIVGGSGAGKTSFLHAVNGFSPATAGAVNYDGQSLYENLGLFRSVLGYVPQDDIVHTELTVERTLYYGAKLRLPPDTGREEIGHRIDEVLAAVGLTERRHTEVRRLSGGQRKRVSVALELLAKPKVLFLDEPTSGLDPALEGRMMSLFCDLTESGATVIVSTHVTQRLRMCDRIAWLAPGGRLVFFGSPAEALRHFGVEHFGEIYALLEAPEDRDRWAAAFPGSPAYRSNVEERLQVMPPKAAEAARSEPAVGHRQPPAGPLRQLFWLTVRYAEVMVRDRPHLAMLLLQAPAVAVILLLLFDRGIFTYDRENLPLVSAQDTQQAVIALHVMTAFAIFLGASNAAREITKEMPIYARERLVNLGVVPYVLSKVAVLSVLSLIQSTALLGIFAAGVDLGDLGWDVYPKLLAAIFLASLGGMSMGLLVSAAVKNSDWAMALVPLIIIPQLLFAGALVPLEAMSWPAEGLAHLTMTKWSLELAGSMTEVAPRLEALAAQGFELPYRNTFEVSPWGHWGALAGFVIGMLGATILIQRRKDIL